MDVKSLCFCGSNLEFKSCCSPFINQQKLPSTPEELMRSRYSAFNIGDINYLIDTLAPNMRQVDDYQLIKQTYDTTHWLGLKIIASHISADNHSGQVDFVAFFKDEKNQIAQLHEKSQFNKIDNRWYYVDGQFLSPIKISRNDSCFCQSGKKYKKCHGG